MEITWLKRCLLALGMMMAANAASGADLHGRSSTQMLWFNNDFNNHRQVELAEYLTFSLTNIDKAGKFSIYGYGRASQDFNNGDGLNGRLYYLYGEYRGLYDKVDLRLGRQFVNLSAGSAIIDGVQVDVTKVGPVAFTLLGGRDVLFGIDGETGYAWNTDLGLAARLEGFKTTDAEVSWLRRWDHGDIARDLIGGTFKQYLFNSIRLYGNARYDLVTESFQEVQAGIKYYPLSNLIFTAEYYQSYPIFDTTSIYSVFAVDQYREGVFRAEYIFNDIVSVNVGYNRERFGDDAHADVYHIGTGLHPIKPLTLNVEYDNRQGYYGSTNGIIVDAAYDFNKTAGIAAGVSYDVYQRDVMTNDEIARRYYLAGKYRLAKNMALSGRIQDDVNASYTENVSGRLVFDYDF